MRIAPERLKAVADFMFKQDGVTSGTQLGREIGIKKDTLWVNMRRRGLAKNTARSLASAMDREATKLREAARDLRAAAKDV